jgi:hypothetical protein
MHFRWEISTDRSLYWVIELKYLSRAETLWRKISNNDQLKQERGWAKSVKTDMSLKWKKISVKIEYLFKT